MATEKTTASPSISNTSTDVEQVSIEIDKLSPEEALNEKALAPLTPVPSHVSSATASSQPDGGTRAWLQVLGSFITFGNLWGFTFAFGSFQSYYTLTYLPDISASTISWIGTLGTFLLIVVGIISGPLFDLGYFRTMLLTGAAIETLGVFMLSLCRSYPTILVTQGLVLGLGNGLLYLPGLALVGRSFKRHRAMAMGITTCGAPTGGVIYTLVFEQLIPKYGFPWTVRIMGFIMLSSYAVSFPLLLFRAKNVGDIAKGRGEKRKLFDKTALRDRPFWTYTMSNFLVFCGYMVPFFFMASYGQTELGMSRSHALQVIMIAQASSVLGRLVAAFAASRIGVMVPWITCALSSGVFCIAWIGVKSQGSFTALMALYGCFSGALIPLPPSIFPVVCPDPRVLGTRLGMAQAVGSVASLIGSPIAGALANLGRRYMGLQLFSGLLMMTGGLSLIGLWVLLVKRRGKSAQRWF